MAQVVQHLPSKYKALSSKSGTSQVLVAHACNLSYSGVSRLEASLGKQVSRP
jgi:hypothetical protein